VINLTNYLKLIIVKIKNHIHSPSKILISKVIDNVVVQKLSEYEAIVHANFKLWYKQSIINIVIVCILIAAGLVAYAFTDKTGLLKLTVAIAYLFSIGVFGYRRVLNIKTLIINWENICIYSNLCFKGLLKYPYKSKIKNISYDVYLKIYNDNITNNKKTIHTIASKLHIIPTNTEIFEIIYLRFIVFYQDVVLSNVIKFIGFVCIFSILGFFVKNLVLLEMHFDNIFETINYPIMYFINVIIKMA